MADSTLGPYIPATGAPSPASCAAECERVALLVELVEGLEPEERRVIELRNLDGLTYTEIAAMLGGSDDRVRLLHQRATLRLGRLCAHLDR